MNDLKNELRKLQLEMKAEELDNMETIDLEKIRKEKLERQKNQPDIKPDSLTGGWFLYIVVMIGGMIFNAYLGIAIVATIYFFYWRHDQIERANGRKHD